MNQASAPRVNIAGTGISNISLDETLSLFEKWIRDGAKKRVCVTPVNCVVWANEDKALREIYNTSDLTLCDGVPLIWASRLLGSNILKGRVTGLDLLPAFTERCYKHNYSMFFVGSTNETNQRLRETLEAQYPGIRITGTYSPPFAKTFSAAENRKICSMVNAVRPDILWVSLTAPKQDFWIAEVFSQLDTRIAIGIGGALDVMAGNIKRAPVWMQKNGLEWFFRFCMEPRRLFKRYFIEAPKIFSLIMRQRRNT